jgi:hypothetical protein
VGGEAGRIGSERGVVTTVIAVVDGTVDDGDAFDIVVGTFFGPVAAAVVVDDRACTALCEPLPWPQPATPTKMNATTKGAARESFTSSQSSHRHAGAPAGG